MALIEGIIHHQDIRPALGVPRSIPRQRVLPALRTALIAVDAGGFWRARGVRLVATDVLTGPGQGKLARRIGG